MKPIRFTGGSRRHRIGKASVYHVIANCEATIAADASEGDTFLSWIGRDERGRELEVVAVEKSDCFLVIHVMPTHYRKETP